MAMPSFRKDQIREFLAERGYTCHPEGLIHFTAEYVVLSESSAYLDINADAVRKGDEVPDHPVRLTFHKRLAQPFPSWELEGVEELKPGIETNALKRQPGTPKIFPWPNKTANP